MPEAAQGRLGHPNNKSKTEIAKIAARCQHYFMTFSSHNMTTSYCLHHRQMSNIFLPKYWPSWWRACAPTFHGQNLDEIEKGQESSSGGTFERIFVPSTTEPVAFDVLYT